MRSPRPVSKILTRLLWKLVYAIASVTGGRFARPPALRAYLSRPFALSPVEGISGLLGWVLSGSRRESFGLIRPHARSEVSMAVHAMVSQKKRFPKTTSLVLAGTVFLAGCGEPEKPAQMFQGLPQKFEEELKFEKAQTLGGTVNDEKEPVTEERWRPPTKKGNTIAETLLEGSNRFSIVIPAGTPLPILLKAYREGSEPLIVAVADSFEPIQHQSQDHGHRRKSQVLGRLYRKNLMAAAMMSSTVPEEGQDHLRLRGDPTKRYGGWH